MTRTELLTLAMLIKVSRQLDRVLHGQRQEENRLMKIQDVLDRAGTSLDALAADDAALLAEMTIIQENGGTLTAEQEAQATAALARIDSLDQADKDALAAAQASQGTGGPVDPGTGDTGTADTNV